MRWFRTTYTPGSADVRYEVTYLSDRHAGGEIGSGDFARRLTFDARQRHYLFHVPPNARPDAPVVLVLHGGGGCAALAKYQSQMNVIADREGFVVVYPAGTNSDDGEERLYWNTGRPMNRGESPARDVDFIAKVLADLGRFVSVSSTRVFACGISNGAQMCFKLASELPQIKAIMAVCGWMGPDDLQELPEKPFPMLVFAGDRDRFAPILGGGQHSENSPFREYSIMPLVDCEIAWRRFNRFTAPVVMRVLAQHGHCWPGGLMTTFERDFLKLGPMSSAYDASEEAWRLFKSVR